MERRHRMKVGAVAIIAALAGGCAGAKRSPADASHPDETPADAWRKNELRSACLKGNSGTPCWELSTYYRRQGDGVRALVFAKKACLLGIGGACYDVTARTRVTFEMLAAEQMLQRMPNGLTDAERCTYWQRQVNKTSPALARLRNWTAHMAGDACAPMKQAALEKIEAEYQKTEKLLKDDTDQKKARRARRRPCKWRCISAAATDRRSCRTMGELSSGPCHDRSQADTDRCLAVCETIQ